MSKEEHDLPSIFSAAIEIKDSAKRLELVEQLCQGRPHLLEQVNDLIKAHHSAKSFLSSPPDLYQGPATSDATPIGQSVLQSMKSNVSVSPVVLRDDNSGLSEPIIKPGSSEVPNRDADDKYQLQGEIARGGMGAILKGRDVDLGRSLAIKVLLDSHKDNPQIIQRFVEEAQIGGQLQHPGITPVYELGQFADQRPFFTMKLVKGKTLAAMLSERKDIFDRGKLLGIFEQICQTMAYAHSRGVIHRDLKPANIMVGAFGEVQVMDWGLAKVLESGGTADEKKARLQHANHSVIQTFRSDGSGPAMVGTDPANAGETLAGSVMGTPAYMPPEQARGEVERLDERCDVFGLGAILCEILTGRPPYFDDNPREVLSLAQRGDLETAFKDLDICRADAELVEIAKESLAAKPTNRIRDAKILAERVSSYLEGVEAKLHETELARAKEATRAIEARKRQRVTMALAASILMTLGLGTAAWIWNQNQFNQRRMAATDQVNEALGEARLQQGLAESAPLSKKAVELEKAIANASTANELAESDAVGKSLKESANELLVSLQQQLQSVQERNRLAEADQKLKEKLEFIRLSHADGKRELDTRRSGKNFNTITTSRKYREAFREAGHDLAQAPETELVSWIKDSEIRETLISSLDHWARCLPAENRFKAYLPWTNATSWEEAVQIAKELRDNDRKNSIRWLHYGPLLAMINDDDAYRRCCNEMLAEFGQNKGIYHQERICKTCLIKPGMIDVNDVPDRWETFLDLPSKPTAMKGWLPWGWNARAMLAYRSGEFDKAKKYAEKSMSFELAGISDVLNQTVLALAEYQLGHREAAQSALKSAQSTFQSSLKVANDFHHDHVIARAWLKEAESTIRPNVNPAEFVFDKIPLKKADATRVTIRSLLTTGSIHERLFEIANAVDSNKFRKSVRVTLQESDVAALKQLAKTRIASEQPPETITALANALREAEEIELAISILRNGQREHPGDFWINFELSRCLTLNDQLDEGIGFARTALGIRPTSVGAMWAVTSALIDADRDDEAMKQFESLLAKSDLSPSGYEGLASSMEQYGMHSSALLAINKALDLDPNNTFFLTRLSKFQSAIGNDEEALATIKRALKIDEKSGGAQSQHAILLWKLGREADAIKVARQCTEWFPDNGYFFNMLGTYLRQTGETEEAIKAYERAAVLSPGSENIRANLANAYSELGMLDESGEQRRLAREGWATKEKVYRKTLGNDPKSSEAWYDLGYVLFQQRKIAEAAEAFEKAIEINDKNAAWYYKYGHALRALDRNDDALKQWKKAVELSPELAKYHERVGRLLMEMDRNEEAVPFLQKAVELNPQYTPAKQKLASALQLAGKPTDALEIIRETVEQTPNNPQAHLRLAGELFKNGKLSESEQSVKNALALKPRQPEQYVYLLSQIQAAQGKTDEAIATIEKALDESDHPVLHCSLADIVYLAFGDTKRAEAEYRKAIESETKVLQNMAKAGLTGLLIGMERFDEANELFPDDERIAALPILYTQKIMAKFLSGEKEAALKEIEQFVADRPQMYHGYNTWASMLIADADKNGEYPHAKKAVELAKKACELRLNHASSIATLGIAQFREGNLQAAFETLKKAEQLGYRVPGIWLYLSMIHSQNGDTKLAQQRIEQAEAWIKNNHVPMPQINRLLEEASREFKKNH